MVLILNVDSPVIVVRESNMKRAKKATLIFKRVGSLVLFFVAREIHYFFLD